jgi:hypothetical protein
LADILGNMRRTHHCNALSAGDMGKEVVLMGWVLRRRDHGGVIFIDLRDREGITQVVFNPEINPDVHAKAHALRSEFVLGIRGRVEPRPDGMINPKLPTGEIEVLVDELKILNPAKTPPFMIEDNVEVSEALRLKNRHLDLRRPPLQRNIITRHKASASVRRFLDDNGFLDIETPVLTKSTPEGARDYLVPSRVNPGQFYALPQSPQLFKQLAHGFRVRPLLPDRALLPGRGSAGRPTAGVHPDRYGNVLCGRGRPHGDQRRHDGQPVQRGCQPDAAPAFSPAHLRRGPGSLRAGQARHPIRSGTQRCFRYRGGLRIQGLFQRG